MQFTCHSHYFTTLNIHVHNNCFYFIFSGGQLGLWVGISMITLCEIVEFLSKLLLFVTRGVCNVENTEKRRIGERTDLANGNSGKMQNKWATTLHQYINNEQTNRSADIWLGMLK